MHTKPTMKWTKEFCGQLIKLDLGIKWGCSARVDIADPDLFDLMYGAGCRWVGFGVESGNQQILDNMNKKITPEMASKAIAMARQSGLWANATFIIGYTGENEETFLDTAKFMKGNDVQNDIFFAQAYPGTELFRDHEYRIKNRFGSIGEYIKRLGDGKELVMSFCDMVEEQLIYYRKKAMNGELWIIE